MWPCEFCGHVNDVNILPGEMPISPDVTYMIAPAPSTRACNMSGSDQTLVVFCIDISGSMTVTQEVCLSTYLNYHFHLSMSLYSFCVWTCVLDVLSNFPFYCICRLD